MRSPHCISSGSVDKFFRAQLTPTCTDWEVERDGHWVLEVPAGDQAFKDNGATKMSWRARLSKSFNELRIVYCSNSPSSIGTREFLKKNYTDLKALNPGLPMYVRPAQGVEPHVAARYARGVYEVRPTTGMSAEEVINVVEELEAAAPEINSTAGRGIGGDKFKLADII